MFCDSCSEPIEMSSVVRLQNRALRTIVRRLRATVRNGQEKADTMFVALCETNPSAEQAMRELWERAGFECSPENYDFMVEMAVRCINDALGKSGARANREPEPAVKLSAAS